MAYMHVSTPFTSIDAPAIKYWRTWSFEQVTSITDDTGSM